MLTLLSSTPLQKNMVPTEWRSYIVDSQLSWLFTKNKKENMIMKNYKKIPFNRVKDFGSYVEKKLREGHVIIRILINENEKEIAELVGYANDKECKSYYMNLADSEEQLRASVITEELEPYYAFKDSERAHDVRTDDIDIETDCQNIISFQDFKEEFSSREKEFYNGISFSYDGEMMHCEFYISTNKGNIANFGRSMELDFITEWMTEHGYYSK